MLDFWKCDWTHHFVVAGMIHEAGSSRLIVTKTSRSDAYPIEVAWELYRKAYMDGMFPAKNKQLAYGSMYPMRANVGVVNLRT